MELKEGVEGLAS